VQISVWRPNAWNIKTFTISLLLFDQFWWNFERQSIFALPSWWVTKSLRILKSKLTDGGQLENWEKLQFPSILYPQTANKVQITVFMPNTWNIQTFTICLLTFDQFWWNFTWQGIFTFTSWCMTKSLRILKSSRKLRKISIFFYSLPQNSGKSAHNRFRAKLVKYSNFYDIFADVWHIWIKFHVARRWGTKSL